MAFAASAAAAQQRARLQEEEEEMTKYSSEDLEQDWEFKIVRANYRTFHKPESLRRLLDEEGQAGWVLVEKFDDMRVRLKRRRRSAASDSQLPPGYDPYRTHFGMSPTAFAWLIVAGTLLGSALLILVLVALVE